VDVGGRGIKDEQNFADVLYGWALSPFFKSSLWNGLCCFTDLVLYVGGHGIMS
jgi:hypothetical protein